MPKYAANAAVDVADPKYDDWKEHFVMGPITEAPDVADNVLYDGQLAEHAVATLRRLQDRPFFLMVGFIRPHVPYVAPKRYWDLYDPRSLPIVENPYAPAGAPGWALPDEQDHDRYHGIEIPVGPELARHLVHGYYACVSYIDAQVGKVLAELDRLGLADNTIVVLWGDHGYHLGENGRWGKQTCYETANRLPLIVRAPGRAGNGASSAALLESIDIYPTLCDLAGVPASGLDGVSFARLLDRPGQPFKDAVFSQFPRPGRSSAPGVKARPDDKMGYSVRTDRYRYIEWRYVTQPRKIAARELYDYQIDPLERENLSDRPAYRTVVEELGARLGASLEASPRSARRRVAPAAAQAQ
jgi:arylsulfatase A-like enzyme